MLTYVNVDNRVSFLMNQISWIMFMPLNSFKSMSRRSHNKAW